ncbi:phosphatidylglycerol lysyltransferase [Rhodococcus sp. OAS809]|jgi:phosphatidylglycerol lysyltransferase|uniref:bifunctional lysylphosphatidylglycerol flippase/synthetase MprF n=1 Tax=Rhodococcus TaxID=1827 RepID=UPI0003780773|nr:DUF2156 domain-containing protein [Rhodococcus erythropolis]
MSSEVRTSEPASAQEPAAPLSAATPKDDHTVQAFRRVVLRFPLTFAVVCALLVIGVVSQGLWRSVEDASWFDSVAYGVPAFQEGRWWTVLLGPWFGLTPAQNISLILLVGVGLGVGEWRLGSRRTALTAAAGQLVGVLGTCAFLALGKSVEWEWAAEVAEALDVGCTTAVVAVLAAATATVKSPWRLRTRILLCSYVIVSFLFLGRFADLTHLFAFVTFLLAGEKWFSRSERGVRPRTRREARLVSAFGVWLIAVVHIVVYFFPGSGPFGPTSAHQVSAWSTVFSVVVAGVLGEFLRRGRRWAWRLTVFYAVFVAVLTLVVLILVVVNDFESVGAVTAGTGLLWAGEAVLLIAGRSAFTVPWRRRVDGARGAGGDVIEDVKSSIRRHGGSTMSWMITWDGMNYYFGAENNGLIGYRRHAGTIIALADPVSSDVEQSALIGDFVRFCETQGTTPCFFSVSAAVADRVQELGWQVLQIAEDTIIDLPDLQLKGKKWQNVRSALNKAEKAGTSFVLGKLGEQSDQLRTQVREISEQWVGEKELPEMGFTLGTVEDALDPDVRIALAVDSFGIVQAVLSWLPVYGAQGFVRGWTLDVMRKRSGPGANNMIEFLIARSALSFKDEGAQFVSLSGAPLARATGDSDIHGLDRGLDMLGQALEPFYGFRSLHQFKAKFNPRFEPVFLCFRDEADLPRIGLAISRAYLPTATPRQLIALMRSTGE